MVCATSLISIERKETRRALKGETTESVRLFISFCRGCLGERDQSGNDENDEFEVFDTGC